MYPQAVHPGPGIGDVIALALERHGGQTAMVNPDGTSITYRQLSERIQHVMRRLADKGVRHGDSVMLLGRNRFETFAATAACYVAGHIAVSPHFNGSLEDQLFILNSCKARVLIVDGELGERALQLQARCDAEVLVLSQDPCPGLDWLWSEPGSPSDSLRVLSHPHDVVRLIYTGGTTGSPKGVMASSLSIAMNAMIRMAAHNWAGLKYLCASPMSHAAGQLIVPVMSQGGTIYFHDGFNVEHLLDELESGRINAFYAVPTMLYKLLDHPRSPGIDYAGLRMIMYGAAPISPARLKQARTRFGPVLIQHYGLSEAPSTVLYLDEQDHLNDDYASSAGRPYWGVAIRLLDEEGNDVEPGQVGEICVRSPLVMTGYWNEPELTEEAFRGGWLHSGDMAWRNSDGYYFLVDRKKDMIISGGFNVYPKEVEDALSKHPDVADVAVIGVPDPTWGEAVKALVVRRKDAMPDENELIDFVKKIKGSIQAPKTVEFIDQVPVTPLGKPDKKAMRANYWSQSERNVN